MEFFLLAAKISSINPVAVQNFSAEMEFYFKPKLGALHH
jgi:hypothetical protein